MVILLTFQVADFTGEQVKITPDIEEYYKAFDDIVENVVDCAISLPRLETLLFQGKHSQLYK